MLKVRVTIRTTVVVYKLLANFICSHIGGFPIPREQAALRKGTQLKPIYMALTHHEKASYAVPTAS